MTYRLRTTNLDNSSNEALFSDGSRFQKLDKQHHGFFFLMFAWLVDGFC